jgi:hypothetical protein
MSIKKVFASAESIAAYEPLEVVASYAEFTFIRGNDADLARLGADHRVEDVTDHYRIRCGGETLRPAARPKKLGRTPPHHYLVQFVGPTRRSWLSAVKR